MHRCEWNRESGLGIDREGSLVGWDGMGRDGKSRRGSCTLFGSARGRKARRGVGWEGKDEWRAEYTYL